MSTKYVSRKCAVVKSVLKRKPLVQAIAWALMGGWILPTSSFAVPAIPTNQTLTQPSGITFSATQWGNELVNGWETEDGYTVILDSSTGNWTVARLDPVGRLISSTVIIGKTAIPSNYPKHIRPRGQTLQTALNVANQVPVSSAKPLPAKGTVKLPVLLVNFTDTTTTYTSQDFNALLFGDGKSAKAYFSEVSRNALTLATGEAGISNWYTASNIHDYYGLGRGYSRAGDLVKEVVQAADNAGVDFAEYDNDGDCFVDSVIVIHQGNGAEAGGNTKNIWSHQGRIATYTTTSTATCGNVKVSNYIVLPETLLGKSSTIGAVVHEIGHALGLTEPADVTTDPFKGVGVWDATSIGAWNGTQSSGDSPAHFAAPTKVYLKWVDPVLVNESKIGEVIGQVATEGKIYQLSSNGKTLVVENRQRVGFDMGLPGSGIALWNVVDSTTNKVEMVQADVATSPTISEASDLFSSDGGQTTFIDTTANIGVTAIGKSQASMVATLCADATPDMTIIPSSLELAPRDQKTFTISSSGCGNLQIGSLSVGGKNSAEFSVKEDNCSNRTIPAGQNCTVKVARSFNGSYWLAPSSSATLSVASNVPNASSVEVALKANGCYQYLATSSWPQYYPFWSSNIDFGTELVGDSSTLGQSLWMRTWGNRLDCNTAPQIKEVTVTGDNATDFTLKNAWGQQCYHAKNSYSYNWNGKDYPYSYSYSYCWFNNKFAPSSEGVKTAGLNVAFNSPDMDAAIVPLKAKAVTEGAASIQVSPDSATFKDTFVQSRSTYQIFGLKNVGEVNLKWPSVSTELAGIDAADFKAFKWWYTPVLMPSQQAIVYTQFSPTSLGTKQASLFVNTQSTSNVRDGDRGELLSGNAKEAVDCSKDESGKYKYVTIETTDDAIMGGAWAEDNNGDGKYEEPTFNVWNRVQQPNGVTIGIPTEQDVVLIKSNHIITGIPIAKVKAVCIEEDGTLESMDGLGSQLRIEATDYFWNKGTIFGKDGDTEGTGEENNCAISTKVGTNNCAKPGANIHIQVGNISGNWDVLGGRPFNNEGTITSGKGGDGSRYSAKGGDVTILASGFTHTSTGKIIAGNGGDLSGTLSGKAERGGIVFVNGAADHYGYITTVKNSLVQGGNGGNCNAEATESQAGGNGGYIWLTHPRLGVQGINKAGKAGQYCNPKGYDGRISFDPASITFGTTASVEAGDVEIYGGDEWVLDLSNLNKTVINATGNVTLAVGVNAVIDLRGNNTPIINTTGELRIFSDSIMLDEGVMLEDIFKAANIVIGPHKILHKVLVMGSGNNLGEPGTTVPVSITLANAGPTKDTYILNVTDTEGWAITALPETIEVEGLQTVELTMNVTLPMTRGLTNAITVTANLQDDPQVESSATVYASVAEERVVIKASKYTASGKVFAETKPILMPLEKVTVQIGDQTTVTDRLGYWKIEGLTNGTYTATATKNGHTIPSQQVVINGEDLTFDFGVVYTAYGTLKNDQKQPVAGATIAIGDKQTQTDAAGNWKIEGLPAGESTLVASKDGYKFAPEKFVLGDQEPNKEILVTPASTLVLKAKPTPWQAIRQGETVTYTYTLFNGGTQTATGLTFMETVPPEAKLVSLKTLGDGDCQADTLTCSLPDLTAGATAQVELVLQAIDGRSFKNIATVVSNEYPADVQAHYKTVKPHLSVTVTDSPDPVVMLKDLHYTATVELSPLAPEDTAKDINLVMQLPKGLELKTVTAAAGTCDSSQFPLISCQLPNLSIATPVPLLDKEGLEVVSQTAVNVDVTLKDAGLLVLTNEAKVTASNYPAHTVREKTNIFIPDTVKIDMVLVIDTTNSMAAEINGLKDAIDKLIEDVPADQHPTMALVEFKDEVRVKAFTQDTKLMKSAVEKLVAEGGGTCPEASVEALEVALKHLKDGGTILLVTDASPYPEANVEELVKRIQSGNLTFNAIVTGDCSKEGDWNEVTK